MNEYKPYTVEDVINASNENRFTVISCFAGGGGSSTGYRLAGGKVLLINEFVEEAISSYKQNYTDTKILVDDIKNTPEKIFFRSLTSKRASLIS